MEKFAISLPQAGFEKEADENDDDECSEERHGGVEMSLVREEDYVLEVIDLLAKHDNEENGQDEDDGRYEQGQHKGHDVPVRVSALT